MVTTYQKLLIGRGALYHLVLKHSGHKPDSLQRRLSGPRRAKQERMNNRPLNIVADENIPLLPEFFSEFGEITTCAGRQMSAADVADADILLVRSVTKVNRQLLEGSRVRFVATATSGTDHVDQDWLQQNGIGFASAAGCNADAVVDYVLAALDSLGERDGFSMEQRKVGIVGYGQVGSRLYRRLTALGVACVVSDPFKTVPGDNLSFDELLAQSDVVTFHTPLTDTGDYPTRYLLNRERLQALRPGTLLINAGRGEVVDNNALKERLQTTADITAVLDVWDGEPALDPEVLELVAIGTPHIAGYSLDGKVRGTAMIYDAACDFFDRKPTRQFDDLVPRPVLHSLGVECVEGDDSKEITAMAVQAVYDIYRDDQRMRRAVKASPENIPVAFDLLRRNYPKRREFNTLKVSVAGDGNAQAIRERLSGLGFRIREQG